MFCHPITNKEKDKLMNIVSVSQAWTCTNTCASFASETFYDVTGIDIDADDAGFASNVFPLIGVETPREIGKHIIEANGGASLPVPLPWEDDRRDLQGASVGLVAGGGVSSFTALWFQTCYP